MIDEIRARFMERFREIASGRVARARSLAAAGADEELARELHALAGEAAVMGLAELAELARETERGARAGGPLQTRLDHISRALDERR